MDIVILAGGKCSPSLAQSSGKEWRCDLERGGRSFLDITLSALQPLGSLIVVGPHAPLSCRLAPPGGAFIESLKSALSLVESPQVLLATADMPWITEEAVKGFVERCKPEDDITYPIIWADDCSRRFPGLARTSVRLKEGRFTGGNLALCQLEALKSAIPVLEEAYARRKSPLGLARLLGADVALRLALGTLYPAALNIPWLEGKVSRLVHSKVAAQICPFPELGADIDSEEQLAIMNALEKSAV